MCRDMRRSTWLSATFSIRVAEPRSGSLRCRRQSTAVRDLRPRRGFASRSAPSVSLWPAITRSRKVHFLDLAEGAMSGESTLDLRTTTSHLPAIWLNDPAAESGCPCPQLPGSKCSAWVFREAGHQATVSTMPVAVLHDPVGAQLDATRLAVVAATRLENRVQAMSDGDWLAPMFPMNVPDGTTGITAVENTLRMSGAPASAVRSEGLRAENDIGSCAGGNNEEADSQGGYQQQWAESLHWVPYLSLVVNPGLIPVEVPMAGTIVTFDFSPLIDPVEACWPYPASIFDDNPGTLAAASAIARAG